MDVAIGLGLIAAMIFVVAMIVIFLLKLVFAIITFPFKAIAMIGKKKEPRVYHYSPRPRGGTLREIRERERQERREQSMRDEERPSEWKYDSDYYRQNPGS